MKVEALAYKEELSLDNLVYKKIYSSGIVSFRKITQILGVNFHLSREQTFQLLKSWEKKRWIKIHPYHGVEFIKEVSG